LIDRFVWLLTILRSGEGRIDHGYSAPFHDGVGGDMAACGVWCVSVSCAGYCSMA
jgi:hypothetical protein